MHYFNSMRYHDMSIDNFYYNQLLLRATQSIENIQPPVNKGHANFRINLVAF